MKQLLSLFVALLATTALWASNTITYTATEDLSNEDYLIVGKTTFGPAITSHTFSNGTGTITCSGEITKIGGYAFIDCHGLTSVVIPNSVTTIGMYAFRGCSFTSVIIPNSVTTIGNRAFDYCDDLTSVTIPASVITIGEGIFASCNNLMTISVDAANTHYVSVDGVLFNYAKDTLMQYPAGKKETTYTIPNSVITIGGSAFVGCYSLTSVTIPKTVTTIGGSAFYSCYGLTSITIPNSVTTIERWAFASCYLTSITIPNSVTTIGESAFYGCDDLTSINVDAGNTHYCSIDGVLFNYAKDTLIQYPAGNTRTTYTIPNSVTTIGEWAFAYCYGLTSVTIPNSVTTIGSDAFFGCDGLTSVTIPNSVTTIGDYAFSYCSGLTSVTIPNSVTTIGNYAFYDCRGLTSVTIPSSVTTIGSSAFESCYGLTSITIPNSVTTIGDHAFYECKNLKTVTNYSPFTFYKGSTDYGYVAYYAAVVYNYNYIRLGDFIVTPEYQLVEYTGKGGSISIPSEVTSIADNVFADNTTITAVTISASVKSIGTSAFKDCYNIRTITCYAPVPPTLGTNAFSGLSQYTKVYVLKSSLEDYQFALGWRDFNLFPISAEEISTTEVTITPTENTATITWPANDKAAEYVLEITKDGVVFCTLKFNAQGQLTGIAFAPSRGAAREMASAEMTANGWQFTVTGLNQASKYGYTLDALNAGQQSIKHYEGEFATDGYTGINRLTVDNAQCTMKFIRNNQLHIFHNGKMYNALGDRMR